MRVKKIIVQKSKTERKGHNYSKTEYCLEAELSENDNPQQARDTLIMLIESWLNEKR